MALSLRASWFLFSIEENLLITLFPRRVHSEKVPSLHYGLLSIFAIHILPKVMQRRYFTVQLIDPENVDNVLKATLRKCRASCVTEICARNSKNRVRLVAFVQSALQGPGG